ncbi:FIG022199: FAD-binding protein, partial [hydrothermal vent metagenome]
KDLINQDKVLGDILKNAKYDTRDYEINAYSGNVSRLYGDGYAVLGNAGEFLDPVFSSGVTVALQSSDLAVRVLDKMLKGQAHDWDKDFVAELKIGVQAFKCFVNNWYTGGFQDVIYAEKGVENIRAMIASILAGYAWDIENPFVAQPQRRLESLIKICQQ